MNGNKNKQTNTQGDKQMTQRNKRMTRERLDQLMALIEDLKTLREKATNTMVGIDLPLIKWRNTNYLDLLIGDYRINSSIVSNSCSLFYDDVDLSGLLHLDMIDIDDYRWHLGKVEDIINESRECLRIAAQRFTLNKEISK